MSLMKNNDLTDFLLKIEELTRSGLKYSKDEYAIDNYKQLEAEVKSFLAKRDIVFEGENIFKRNIYPTPSVSVRSVIFSEDRKQVFMVQERSDSRYSLPGGFAELSLSPSESALKEVYEEAGSKAEIVRLVAVLDRYKNLPTRSAPEYIIAFEAKLVGKRHKPCFEILSTGYFPIDNLPPISRKNDPEQMRRIIAAASNRETIFD